MSAVHSSPMDAIGPVANRLSRYCASIISQDIASYDAMYARDVAGADVHYFAVGRSAIHLIAETMIAANKTTFASVLDCPCGAGRITRHLTAFFPDSQIFVSDLDQEGEAFAAKRFGATRFRAPSAFDVAPDQRFDLIFVGSLLTHFDEVMFLRALKWFVAALEPEGILITTTHGRRAQILKRSPFISAPNGFSFVEMGRFCGTAYGSSLSFPSWLLKEVENMPDVAIISFREAAWDDHQDVLSLQRRSLDYEYRLPVLSNEQSTDKK
jgi:SAM-dependent methyltransferase